MTATRDRMRQPATAMRHLWLHRSSILVLPQLSGFKSFRIQSSQFNFRIQNLRRHDQIEEFLQRTRTNTFRIRHEFETMFSSSSVNYVVFVDSTVSDFGSARAWVPANKQPIRQKSYLLQVTNQPSSHLLRTNQTIWRESILGIALV